MAGDYENMVGPYGGLQFPSLELCETDPSRVIAYRDRVYSKYAAYRRRQEARWAVNFQYLIDNQWLDLISMAVADANTQTYSLRFLQDLQDGMPRPVTNILAPNVEIELSTYNKRKFMPKAVAANSDPWNVDAAMRMTAVLRDKARRLNWNQIRQRAAMYVIVGGTSSIRSWWDQDFSDFEEVASPFALQCSACGQYIADALAPWDMKGKIRFNSDSLQPVPDNPLQFQITNCPNCDSRGTLQPAEMNEAQKSTLDALGRKLFVKVPIGKPSMEALDPFVLYPENGGVGVTYDRFRVMHSVTARSLDWIADRHPEWAGQIRPDSQTELLRRNPLLGEFSSFVWYGPTIDTNIFTNHALYYEMICKPCGRLPKGALIRSCNNLILQHEPLIWDYEDRESGFKMSTPRVEYSCGVWMERPGEFFGHSMMDRGRSLQNRLNGRDAQIVDIHERMANPHILAATDMNLTGPEWFEGRYSGKKMQYERSVLAPDDKPMVFGGQSPPAGVWQERDRILSDTRFILGPAEIEQGMSPKNVSTTSGLQLQSENAEQRRGPREDMMDFMSAGAWTHVMHMEQAFRVHDDTYDTEDPESKRWRSEVYNRTVLRGSFRLDIEKTAYVSQSIYNREAAREAQADGLYVVTKPADRKKLLELRGLPTDINQDDNYQVDCANEKWSTFLRKGVVPVIDPTLDNPDIHYDVFSTFLLSDEGKRIAQEANWALVSPLLTDWQTMLQQRQQQDQLARKTYGMWTSPEEAKRMYAQMKVQFDAESALYPAALEEYDAKAMASAAAGVQMPPPPLQPVEPIIPVMLPRPLNLQVLTVWNELLEKQAPNGLPAPEGTDPDTYKLTLDRYLRFRAVRESYGLMRLGAGIPGSGAMGPVPATPGGAPPNPVNAPNPPNVATPGTSLGLSNANMAATTPPPAGG